eukprot:3031-Pelagococcus_subviridis.AAC.1
MIASSRRLRPILSPRSRSRSHFVVRIEGTLPPPPPAAAAAAAVSVGRTPGPGSGRGRRRRRRRRLAGEPRVTPTSPRLGST